MAVSGHVLMMLIPVLSLCAAAKFYVRPTEPTNTSCPAQPCLTLNQYTTDSDHYFKSNTVFKFLPGTHHMDRPLTIGNVHNMSWESDEYPHLVAEFSCVTEEHECLYWHPIWNFQVCCAAVWLHDLHNVTVKGISMTLPVQMSNKFIPLVLLKNVSGVTVQLNATCISWSAYRNSLGITIYEATSVEVHSSSVNNCTYGLVLHNTTKTHINKVTAMYNGMGIILDVTTDTQISKTVTMHNDGSGMDLFTMNNTYITNTITSHNGLIGMGSFYMSNTYITNMTSSQNGMVGVWSINMSNTHITNMTTSHNVGSGMNLVNMSNTYITNMTSSHNERDGMSSLGMNNTHITNMNTSHNGISGMFLSKMSNTHIINTAATHNNFLGIAILRMNNTQIMKTTVMYNGKSTYDSLISRTYSGQIAIIASTYTLIYRTSFTNIYAPSRASTTDLNSLPAVITLYTSTLHLRGCDFTRNDVSAVKAIASNITVSGDVTFSSNRAFAGTAFILMYESTLTSTENSHIHFLNNHATNTGGVFYINNVANKLYVFGYSSDINRCFLNIEGSRFQTRFTFANNSAGIGGDILYGGGWNCLDSFKNISNISQNGLSLMSSDPTRVCLCNETGQPDCMVDPTPHTIYPGQTINISAVVVGQDFGTVAGSVYAQFLQRESTPKLESVQDVQSVIQHKCNHLHYTAFSQSEVLEAVLTLTVHKLYVSEFNNKDYYSDHDMIQEPTDFIETYVTQLLDRNSVVYVNISLLPCPPGFMLTSHSPFKCDCNSFLQQMHGIKCYIQEQTIGRSGLLWVGMIQDDNGTNGPVAATEYCPQDYCNIEESNVTLSEPDSQCNYNHSGTLCGGCQPGLSLALGSAQCMRCSNKYLALLIPLTLAGPVLVFSIKVLDLTISQGTLNGLIFYANVVKANEYIIYPQGQTNPLNVFIAWLNLDLGVETCLFQGLTAYSKTWLQFVFPFYVWSIAGLIIILAKYSDRVAKVMGNNSVPVLATLFLLSYAKLLRTIITALSYTMVYTSHGPKAVWTADGNVDYLGPKHAPLFATAVVALLFLWLPYTLVLFLGQWLHMFNCRLLVRMLMKIKPFLDAHYGPLKSKHHYWFGALLLVRAAILLISALIPSNRSSVVVLCAFVLSVVLTHFGQLVYHNLAVSVFDMFFFMNLAVLGVTTCFTTTTRSSLSVSTYTLIGVVFVQFIGLVIFKVFSILKHGKRCVLLRHNMLRSTGSFMKRDK